MKINKFGGRKSGGRAEPRKMNSTTKKVEEKRGAGGGGRLGPPMLKRESFSHQRRKEKGSRSF